MNELIKVNYDNADRPTVSGRELHEALEVKTAYKDWFPRMCEYGFTEGVDFNLLIFEQVRTEGTRQVKREIEDHQLTIPMAKELCMLQRTDKGKQMRQYFIAVEEQWNSPDAIMARALQMSNAKLKQLETQCLQLEQQAEENKPKVIFADSVAASKSSILVREFAKICKQNGIEVGEKRLFEWLRENGYLIRKVGSDYNAPTQRAMEQGLFEVKETAVTHASGRISTERTPKITGKGQIFFLNKLKSVAESNAGVLDADWRTAADQRIKAYTKEHKINHMKFRKDLYESLEASFGIKFVDLLELLKAKKKKEGWTYRQRNALTNLDVIANNEALKERFDCMMLEAETGQMVLS